MNVLLCTRFTRACIFSIDKPLYIASVWPTQAPTMASILGGINTLPMLLNGVFFPKEKRAVPMLCAVHNPLLNRPLHTGPYTGPQRGLVNRGCFPWGPKIRASKAGPKNRLRLEAHLQGPKNTVGLYAPVSRGGENRLLKKRGKNGHRKTGSQSLPISPRPFPQALMYAGPCSFSKGRQGPGCNTWRMASWSNRPCRKCPPNSYSLCAAALK